MRLQDSSEWYVLKGKGEDAVADGPISAEKLKSMADMNIISSSTLVWHPELDDWTPAYKVRDLFIPMDVLERVRGNPHARKASRDEGATTNLTSSFSSIMSNLGGGTQTRTSGGFGSIGVDRSQMDAVIEEELAKADGQKGSQSKSSSRQGGDRQDKADHSKDSYEMERDRLKKELERRRRESSAYGETEDDYVPHQTSRDTRGDDDPYQHKNNPYNVASPSYGDAQADESEQNESVYESTSSTTSSQDKSDMGYPPAGAWVNKDNSLNTGINNFSQKFNYQFGHLALGNGKISPGTFTGLRKSDRRRSHMLWASIFLATAIYSLGGAFKYMVIADAPKPTEDDFFTAFFFFVVGFFLLLLGNINTYNFIKRNQLPLYDSQLRIMPLRQISRFWIILYFIYPLNIFIATFISINKKFYWYRLVDEWGFLKTAPCVDDKLKEPNFKPKGSSLTLIFITVFFCFVMPPLGYLLAIVYAINDAIFFFRVNMFLSDEVRKISAKGTNA